MCQRPAETHHHLVIALAICAVAAAEGNPPKIRRESAENPQNQYVNDTERQADFGAACRRQRRLSGESLLANLDEICRQFESLRNFGKQVPPDARRIRSSPIGMDCSGSEADDAEDAFERRHGRQQAARTFPSSLWRIKQSSLLWQATTLLSPPERFKGSSVAPIIGFLSLKFNAIRNSLCITGGQQWHLHLSEAFGLPAANYRPNNADD